MTAAPESPEQTRRGPLALVLNLVRGIMIGTAETVPGVSGGTVALMTGVYEPLLTSAGHLIGGIRLGLTDGLRGRGLERAKGELAHVRWAIVVPILVGMGVALVTMAHVMEGLLEDHPETMRGLFLGLVLASLAVPFRHSRASATRDGRTGSWGPREWALAAVAAIVVAVVVSLPGGNLSPEPYVLVPAGALAVSALVLPGLSGSFLLLTMGLYEPTIAALNDRDLGYLALFATGCAIGLVTIVKLLQWLLEHHRRITLVALTGVMAGSLVALWPWQDADGARVAPYGSLAGPLIAMVLGAALVVAVLVVEHRMVARAAEAPADAQA
ncbi:DUF368 domain-containing protein [Demequina mangrovi]|uniref:Putative membrane protein n=1 Tax=Demequina mangrovi TaxID=1043493 RepID=A0A1H6V4F2_9MICO|nr:DUF368 domain-containing protein [Demequina mangrovi]SEI95172.1 putative membrane protein [Demequina mangrovi]